MLVMQGFLRSLVIFYFYRPPKSSFYSLIPKFSWPKFQWTSRPNILFPTSLPSKIFLHQLKSRFCKWQPFLHWNSFHPTLHPPLTLFSIWNTHQACPYKQTSLRLAAGHCLGNCESGSCSLLFCKKCGFVKGSRRWNQGTWVIHNAARWMLISFSGEEMQMLHFFSFRPYLKRYCDLMLE